MIIELDPIIIVSSQQIHEVYCHVTRQGKYVAHVEKAPIVLISKCKTGYRSESVTSRRYGKQLRVGVKIMGIALNYAGETEVKRVGWRSVAAKVARRVFTLTLSHQAPLNF